MLVQLLRIARHGSPQRHGVSFLNFLAWATDLRYASDVRSRYPHPEHAYWIVTDRDPFPDVFKFTPGSILRYFTLKVAG